MNKHFAIGMLLCSISNIIIDTFNDLKPLRLHYSNLYFIRKLLEYILVPIRPLHVANPAKNTSKKKNATKKFTKKKDCNKLKIKKKKNEKSKVLEKEYKKVNDKASVNSSVMHKAYIKDLSLHLSRASIIFIDKKNS